MKHIIIDARLYGPTHTGIGRYVQNILLELPKIPGFNNYRWTLLVYPELAENIQNDLKTNYQYQPTDIRHYSLKEQLLLPALLRQLKADLVHIPHFNKPTLYFGKTIVTIHDLIKHFSKGKDTTTRHPWAYWPKYWAYRLLTYLVIKTNYLIVPSNFWRDFIIHHYGVNPQKIITTYEAVDPYFLKPGTRGPISKYQNYLLYTGNLYPHKNIMVLFEALQKIPSISLKIISKDSSFVALTKKKVDQMGLSNRIEFLGFVDDASFGELYRRALAFVFPSLMEGFGLPGLEAQAMGCPVISSNSSCLPEVYGDSVLYFDPRRSSELVNQIVTLQKSSVLRKKLIIKGFHQVDRYSWSKTAAATFADYERILKS